jgi:glycosyltransferase involved in cell wall biosynthesis
VRPVVGVVVPAHDEEELLADCLAGLRTAAGAVADRARVRVLVVADACTDRTEAVARRAGVDVLRVDARVVGRARRAGAAALRRAGSVWVATTDADSVVPPDWLAAQLDARADGADAWVGTVDVVDWRGLPSPVRRRYRDAYEDGSGDAGSGDAHRHVHGASLGIAARTYEAVGGFPPRATGEDVVLVERLDRAGYRVVRDRTHPVVTSARTDGRAPDGFAGHLLGLARRHVIPTSSSGTTAVDPRPDAWRGSDEGPTARIS